jgi:hypothetical protein
MLHGVFRHWGTPTSWHRLHRPEQVTQAEQVVGDHIATEYSTDIGLPSQFALAQAAELLDPANDLLDPSAGLD